MWWFKQSNSEITSHYLDANLSDNSCNLKKVKHEIADEKEKETMNVNSENVTAGVDIG